MQLFLYFILLLFIGYFSIFAISILYYENLNLLNFINISFFLGGFYLFFSISVFILSSGFFDLVTNSFRKAFSRGKPLDKEEFDSMRSVSEAISVIRISPFLMSGSVIYAVMIIALIVYYS
ncbi:DUF3899 domain-containing protein [Jeotgalibacillus soli]|uniref:DUF3899 domain-containing protein n=1 Tax=Jeotgalibacillus soli TaxID=889306 RepID=UPI0009FE96F1